MLLASVLLVCKDQQHRVAHLILIQHFVEFLSGVLNPIPVVAVDDIDETVGALIVVAPQGADLVLAISSCLRKVDPAGRQNLCYSNNVQLLVPMGN